MVEAAKIAPSSTNMLSEREGDQRSVSLRRGEVKIADRMGERGDVETHYFMTSSGQRRRLGGEGN